MNSNKRNIQNSWVLCKSTRTPGKFYYHNVLTRASVWNLKDLERISHLNSTAAMDNSWHSYPEPEYPPLDHSPPNPWQARPSTSHQTVFGQASFPKYLTNLADQSWGQGSSSSSSFANNNPSSIPIYDPTHSWSGNHGPNYNQMSYQKDNMFSDSNFFDNRARSRQNAQLENFRQFPVNPYYSVGRPLESQHLPKPLSFVKYRSQPQNENLFAANTKSEHVKKPIFPNPILFEKPQNKSCNCAMSKSHENLSKFNDNVPNQFSNQSQSFGNMGYRSKSLESVVFAPKENAFSQQPKTFGFPQNSLSNAKSFENLSNQNIYKAQNQIQNSTVPTFSAFSKPMFNYKERPYNSNLFHQKFNEGSKEIKNTGQIKIKKVVNRDVQTENKQIEEIKKSFQTKSVQVETDKRDGKETVQNKVVQAENGPNLDVTDLRHVLLARRRKNSTNSASEDHPSEAKKIKTSYSSNPQREVQKDTPKKHVTFDLGVEDYSINEGDMNEDGQDFEGPTLPSTEQTDDSQTEEPAELESPNAQCYVIPDVNVLLEDFALMEQFVQKDPFYTLLIPQVVRREVESASTGLANGKRTVLNARQLMRKIADPPEYIVVQSPDSVEECSEYCDDPLLICCLQALEDGLSVILVTDNEELFNKAMSYEILCYTTQDIKDDLSSPKPEVSFDLKRIDNTNDNDLNTTISNKKAETSTPKQLFRAEKDEKENQFFLGQNLMSSVNKRLENLKISSDKVDSSMTQANAIQQNRIQNSQPENITKKVFNNGGNSFSKMADFQHGAGSAAFEDGGATSAFKDGGATSAFKDGGATSGGEIKNGCQVMEVTSTATRKEKNINVYNLKEHLKRFYVKDKAVEDRIKRRIDECVCSFSQIMEVTLSDALKSLLISTPEDTAEPPLWELIQTVRSTYNSHRTVYALTTGLLEYSSYTVSDRSARMKPSDYMKMLGYGTLLIKSLKSLHPENSELSEGESLLDQLHQSLTEGSVEEPSSPQLLPSAGHEPRTHNFVKNPSDIQQYLKNHFPNSQVADTTRVIDKKVTPSCKVVRTSGKKLGFIKLHVDKTIVDENKSAETKDVKEKYTGPKLMKKLVRESTNQPPKLREIDVEKREKVNKEMSNMIDQMIGQKADSDQNIVTDQANDKTDVIDLKNLPKLTRTFNVTPKVDNVKDINNDNSKTHPPIVTKNKMPVVKKFDFKILSKLTRTVNNSVQKKGDGEMKVEIKPDGPKNEEKRNDIKKSDAKRLSPVDLDALDYSCDTEDETLVLETIDKQNLTVKTGHCTEPDKIESIVVDDKTDTTESTQNDENNNDENRVEGNADEERIDDEANSTVDSGFDESYLYDYIKMFLVEVTTTLLNLYMFTVKSVSELRVETSEAGTRRLYERVSTAHKYITDFIQQLKGLRARETTDPVAPSILRASQEARNDVRIVVYRQTISTLLHQARILRDSIKMLIQILNEQYNILTPRSSLESEVY